MGSVLLVDDEPMVVEVLTTMLKSHGHEIVALSDSAEAMRLIEQRCFDLFLFDLRMPDPSGADLAEGVRQRWQNATVLIMTGFPDDPLAARAMRSGVAALVKKPFEIGKILAHLNSSDTRN